MKEWAELVKIKKQYNNIQKKFKKKKSWPMLSHQPKVNFINYLY